MDFFARRRRRGCRFRDAGRFLADALVPTLLGRPRLARRRLALVATFLATSGTGEAAGRTIRPGYPRIKPSSIGSELSMSAYN